MNTGTYTDELLPKKPKGSKGVATTFAPEKVAALIRQTEIS